jgi:hemolysin activation/secretion protein
MNKRRGAQLLLAATLAVFMPLAAQAAEAPPGAGSILQQIQPANPPAPSSNGTGLSIEQDGRTNLPPSAPFPVKSIQLSGNTVVDTATLHALVADAEGKNLTLSQLGDLAARLTDYYRSHGYPLARAIVPAQTIQASAVRIEIIEARYGKIQLDNHSRVSDSLIGSTLSPLQGGQAVAQRPLDHALLLLSDIPGIAVSATLKPGDAVGTSDLQVDAGATPAVTGNVALDNYGNRYTGRARLAGTVDFIDPLHHGDVLSLTALTSGSGLNYGGLSYESLLDGRGTRLGASYTALHYELGDTLETLDGHGTAQVESLWLKSPFMRSHDGNVYGQLQYDHKQLDDHIDTASIRTDRHLDNLTASLAGDLHDSVLSGSVSTWNVGWTVGRVDFDDGAARQVDTATAHAQGSFSKWTANFFRLQSLSARDTLYLTLSGQWANSNLDPAEKMVAGGPYTVRAYDIGAESGDTGLLGSAEFRHELVQVMNGPLQAVAFFDVERATVNHSAWIAGMNGVTLRGAGLGLNWAGADQWRGRIYLAAPIGRTPELIGSNNSVHAWAEIAKGF